MSDEAASIVGPSTNTRKGICSACGHSDKETDLNTGVWICWGCYDSGEVDLEEDHASLVH